MIGRYIDIVAGLAINEAGHIVAVDSVSPTVFRITENGDLIKWFDVSDRMREPSDLAIHGKEYYICDFKVNMVLFIKSRFFFFFFRFMKNFIWLSIMIKNIDHILTKAYSFKST